MNIVNRCLEVADGKASATALAKCRAARTTIALIRARTLRGGVSLPGVAPHENARNQFPGAGIDYSCDDVIMPVICPTCQLFSATGRRESVGRRSDPRLPPAEPHGVVQRHCVPDISRA
jgi:hypothetical protein